MVASPERSASESEVLYPPRYIGRRTSIAIGICFGVVTPDWGEVVVRATDAGTTVVEVVNPDMMVTMTGNPNLVAVATDASARLSAALDSLRPANQTS